MKKKLLRFRWLTLSAVLILSIIACRKQFGSQQDDLTKLADPKVALTISGAQLYFKNLSADQINGASLQTQSTSQSSAKTIRYAAFEKAYEGQTAFMSYVEAPIRSNHRITSIIRSDQTPLDATLKAQLISSSFDRIVIFKDKITGTIDQRILTYMPDENYLNKHNNDASGNKINKLDKDFSGFISYKQLDGNVLFILKILNGVGVYRFLPGTSVASNANKTVNSIQKVNEICGYWTADYGSYCTYADADMTEGEVCSGWTLEGLWFTYRTCGPGGNGGGTNGTGGTTTTPNTPDPCLDPTNMTPACIAMKPSPPIDLSKLKLNFPCAAALIQSMINNNADFKGLVNPFLGAGTPTIAWDNSNTLPWNQQNSNGAQTYQLGQTTVSGNQNSASIYLSNQMLNNSSQLLIEAAIIHEALHAVINYNMATAYYNYLDGNETVESWMYGMDRWITLHGLPSDYSNHYEMLSDYFSKAVGMLSMIDKQHGSKDYAMALLYGMKTAGPTATQSQIDLLNSMFNSTCALYGISAADLTNFNAANLNSTTGKLPTSGCN